MTAEMTEGPPELGMSDSLTPSRSAMRFMASRSSEPWNIYVRPLPSFLAQVKASFSLFQGRSGRQMIPLWFSPSRVRN